MAQKTPTPIREQAAAIMQARLSWPSADALAEDLDNAGLLRSENPLVAALKAEFSETELHALMMVAESKAHRGIDHWERLCKAAIAAAGCAECAKTRR